MNRKKMFKLCVFFITLFYTWTGHYSEHAISKDLEAIKNAGPIAIVFKGDSRYNTFVQGKFERLFATRLIEFPIGSLSNKEILNEIKGYGLNINYLVVVNLNEDIDFQQTAARTGGKQGLWTARVSGQVEFYDVSNGDIGAIKTIQITKQYDDRGSTAGNALRDIAEKGLGDIYYYEKTPEQKILYSISDQVKGSMGVMVEEMIKSDIIPQLHDTHSDHRMDIDPQKSLFENSINYLAKEVIKGMKDNKKITVAVTEFNWTDGSRQDLESYIAEEITTRLTNLGNLTVIERSQLNRAIEELKFNLSDLVDPDHAKKFGKFTGADTILGGTITDMGHKYKINCRLIDSENGTVYSAVSGSIYYEERLEGLVNFQREGSVKK